MACHVAVDTLGYDCFGGIPPWFTGEIKFIVLTQHRVTGVNFCCNLGVACSETKLCLPALCFRADRRCAAQGCASALASPGGGRPRAARAGGENRAAAPAPRTPGRRRRAAPGVSRRGCPPCGSAHAPRPAPGRRARLRARLGGRAPDPTRVPPLPLKAAVVYATFNLLWTGGPLEMILRARAVTESRSRERKTCVEKWLPII